MTYRELLKEMQKMHDYLLDADVTVALKGTDMMEAMNVEKFVIENEWVEGPILTVDYDVIL